MDIALLKKAREAESPEELIKLAEEAGAPKPTEEEAKEYFELLKKSGELSDEEIESAAGGCDSHINKAVGADAQYNRGYRVVTLGNLCEARFADKSWNLQWECNKCHQNSWNCTCYGSASSFEDFFGSVLRKVKESCGTCAKCKY